jgi:uncharacterized protein YjbI with pentapeptide repeats
MKQCALDQLLDHHARQQEQLVSLTPEGSRYFQAFEKTLDLSFTDFRGTSFEGRTLRNVDLSGADLRGVSFKGAVLEHVLLPLAKLDDTDFSGACLTYVSLRDSTAQGTAFDRAEISHCNLTQLHFTGVSFSGATISDATINQCRFNETGFAGAELRNVALRDTRATQCGFDGAVFERVNAAGSRFLRCQFERTTLRHFAAKSSPGPRLERSNVAQFKLCAFKASTFQDCDLSSVRAADSTFEHCSLIASTPFADFKERSIDGLLLVRSAPHPLQLEEPPARVTPRLRKPAQSQFRL